MKYFIVTALLLATQFCIAQYPTSQHPASFKGEQMIVGQGNNEYLLLADGGVYRHKKGAAKYDVLGNQTAANIKTAFGSLTSVRFQEMNFNYPGKTSYFVRFKSGSKSHEVVWGDAKQKTPAEIQKVYKAFMGMVPAQMRY